MAQHGSALASAVDASPLLSPLHGGGGSQTPSFPHPDGSTPATSQHLSQPQHKRVYQACIPCRRRKVRCDLGSVDNPHDPPCVRCRRESKECYFSATRRKRKHDDDTTESLVEDAGQDDYIVRNGRKRVGVDASPPPRVVDRRLYSDVPLTPGGTRGRSQPLRRPGDGYHSSVGSIEQQRRSTSEFGNAEPNQPLENLEAKQVMRTEVYGPHDALDLLYKAATDKSVTSDSHGHAYCETQQHADIRDYRSRPTLKHNDSSRRVGVSSQSSSSFHPHRNSGVHRGSQGNGPGYNERQASLQDVADMGQAIDPELTKNERDPSAEPGYAEALKAWTRFRFVRAGWFTAAEAIDYID